MKTKADIAALEKLIGQLRSLHSELSILAKKSHTDGLNDFKLSLVNKVLRSANSILGEGRLPIEDFQEFANDRAPSTTDATLVLGQYIEEVERYRSENIERVVGNQWRYLLHGEPTDVLTGPPKKLTE